MNNLISTEIYTPYLMYLHISYIVTLMNMMVYYFKEQSVSGL